MSRQGVARVYTSARRHPWVLGRLGDWTVPFGPYTPAQLVVLGGGAFALIKTYALWSWAGPVPVVLWIASVWAVRGAQIAGQNPFTAVLGVLVLLTRHPAGRVGGRIARDRRPSYLRCRFTLAPAVEPLAAPAVGTVPVIAPAAAVAPVPVVAAAGSGLSRLLAGAGQGAA
ncbi:hypothetical protein [Streptomyces erythrochromogenes]|uniref:hypothetical protein n=1 Tax=Streptomyces erythrochromogenes TaxID=285574 RepID=UPI00386CEB3D|nr:hypothetical protein OG489_00160 [Streptomyces erythrochromogenes]WSR88334.1 hypothetical protein OG489_39800 [Streptomyces erythrochromogenes]